MDDRTAEEGGNARGSERRGPTVGSDGSDGADGSEEAAAAMPGPTFAAAFFTGAGTASDWNTCARRRL